MTESICQICGRAYDYHSGALTRTLTINSNNAKSACRQCFRAWLKENGLSEPPSCDGCMRYFRIDLYESFVQPVFDCKRCGKAFCDECVNDFRCLDSEHHEFV